MAALPPTPGRPFRLRYTALSDVGRHRKDNQDSGYASERLLVVADGVGGAAYGDVASSTAVQLLRRLDADAADAVDGDVLPALAGAVHRVHDRLAELVEADAELDGTSTTVTAALFDGARFGFVHVGDSRAYLCHDGAVRQLTKDHTFVQSLVDEGRISEADSRVHPQRNVILRAVDGAHDTEPDLFALDASPGDRVLLCSDGCSGTLEEGEIGRLLASGSVDYAAVALVQAALEGGSTDNVTVVVAEVVPADGPDGPDAADGADDLGGTRETSAAAAVGPMLVGAAAAQPRGNLRRSGGRPSTASPLTSTPSGGDDDERNGARPGGAAGAAVADERPVDEEQLRYAPRPPRRHPVLRRALFVLVPLLLLGGAAGVGYTWSQHQYYVAEDGDGVAIYQGVQVDLPVVDLHSVYEVADVSVTDLSETARSKVHEGIVANDLSDARRIVDRLEQDAETAARQSGPDSSQSTA